MDQPDFLERSQETQKKFKRNAFFCFGFIFLVIAMIITGTVLSLVYVSKNTTLGSQFGASYQVRIALDTSHKSSDPFNDDDARNPDSLDEIAENTQLTANALSNYLESQKIETYNTVKIAGYDYDRQLAYLDVVIPLNKVYDVNDNGIVPTDPKLVDLPGLNSYFATVNSNRITFIIDGDVARTGGPASAPWNKGYTSYVSAEELFVNPKLDLYVQSNKTSVVIKTPDSSTQQITTSQWHDYLEKAFTEPETSADGEETPVTNNNGKQQIYIIRDQETLISRMHYILQATSAHYISESDPTIKNRNEFNDAWKYLTSSEKEWANNVINSTTVFTNDFLFTGGSIKGNLRKNTDFLADPGNFDSSNQNYNQWYENDIVKFCNNYFYRLIDVKNYGINNDGSLTFPTSSETGTTAYAWMDPYVVGYINSTNYSTYFPIANPADSNAKSDAENRGKWIQIDAKSSYGAQQLINALNNTYNFVYPIKIATNGLKGSTTVEPFGGIVQCFKNYYQVNETKSINSLWKVGPSFNNGLFGLVDPLICAIISYILFFLAICAYFIHRYRVSGIFASFALLLINVLALFFFIYTAHLFSFGLLMGLIVGSFLFAFCYLAISERIHKNCLLQNMTADSSVKIGTIDSLNQVIDLHIVALICGLVGIYFGPLAIYEFCLMLLVSAIVSFIGCVIWFFSTWLFFNNHYFRNKKTWLFYKNVNNTFKVKQDEHKSAEQIDAEKQAIYYEYDVAYHKTKKWESVIFNQTFKANIKYYLGIGVIMLALLISSLVILNGITPLNSKGVYTPIMSTQSMLYIIFGFLCLYGLLRLNWSSLLTIALGVLLLVLVCSTWLVLIPFAVFNENLVLVMTFFVIAVLFLFHFVGIINNKQFKYKSYQLWQIKFLAFSEARSFIFHYFVHAFGLVSALFLLLIVTNSINLVLPLIITYLCICASLFVLFFVVVLTLIWFINFRTIYRTTISKSEFFAKNNYDRIDEQLIAGINKHKYIKIS